VWGLVKKNVGILFSFFCFGWLQEFDAYVVGKEGAPGIVVIQEWWGIDFEIKKHATDIASKGYRALIPEYV
jgi:dienelactone hydrolase